MLTEYVCIAFSVNYPAFSMKFGKFTDEVFQRISTHN